MTYGRRFNKFAAARAHQREKNTQGYNTMFFRSRLQRRAWVVAWSVGFIR